MLSLLRAAPTQLIYFFFFLLLVLIGCIYNSNWLFFPEVSKTIFLFYFCILTFPLVIIRSLLLKQMLLKINVLDVLLGILLIYIIVNRYLLHYNYAYSLNFIELIGIVFIYFLCRSCNEKVYPFIFCAIICGGIIQAIYGNLQIYNFLPSNHTSFLITGSYNNPGPYAAYLISILPIALCFYFVFNAKSISAKEKSWIMRSSYNRILYYLSIFCMIGIFSVLPASQSRAAWIAGGITIIFLLRSQYFIYNPLQNHKYKRYLLMGSISILITAAVGIYLFKKDSADGRILIWKVTSDMIKNNVLIGTGFDQFKVSYMFYQANYFENDFNKREVTIADNVQCAFNDPLQFTAENGVLGLLILSAIIYYIIVHKTSNVYITASKAALISILIFSLFSYPSQNLPVKINAMVCLGIISNDFRVVFHSASFDLKRRGSVMIRGVVVLILITIFYTGLMRFKDLSKGYEEWHTAMMRYESSTYKQSIKHFENAYDVFNKNGDFLLYYGKTLTALNDDKKAIEILKKANAYRTSSTHLTSLGTSYQKLKMYDLAESSYKMAHLMVPNKFYPEYLLVKLYVETNQRKRAIQLAQNLIKKDVKIESSAIIEMKSYLDRLLTVNNSTK